VVEADGDEIAQADAFFTFLIRQVDQCVAKAAVLLKACLPPTGKTIKKWKNNDTRVNQKGSYGSSASTTPHRKLWGGNVTFS
jgi:hypothetical protein